MPIYRVEMDGKNFLVDLEGKLAKYGFITFRFVDTDSAHSAESAAVEMLRTDPELRPLVKNQPDDPPVIDVTEIAELDQHDDEAIEQPGQIWYEMNPKRWWQFWR